MSNLDNWLEENQWQLCTTDVKDLRDAVAADIAEALKPSHNTQSTAIAQIAARIDVLADALHDRGEIEISNGVRDLKRQLRTL